MGIARIFQGPIYVTVIPVLDCPTELAMISMNAMRNRNFVVTMGAASTWLERTFHFEKKLQTKTKKNSSNRHIALCVEIKTLDLAGQGQLMERYI